MAAEKTAKKQRGKPFPKGRSGNPAGRPPGSRNKATIAAQELLDGEAEAITRRVVALATSGDLCAIRLCLDRLLPPRRERPVRFDLPEPICLADVPDACRAIMTAVATGDLTPTEGMEAGKVLDLMLRTLEITEIERRLSRLERAAVMHRS